MKKNMGTADRLIRTVIAVAIAVLYFTGIISGTLAILLGIVAVAFLVTSFVSWCPSYVPFGLSTAKPSDQQQPVGAGKQ
jgi:amino acid transporter